MNEPCEQLQARGRWWEDRVLKRCGWPIGPRNTYSNAAYAFAAGWLVWRFPSRETSVLAAALCLLAVGSGLYHGLKTKWANNLDRAGMYAVFGALGIYPSVVQHELAWAAMALTGVLFAVLMVYVIVGVSLDLQMGVLLYFVVVPAFLLGDHVLAGVSMGLFLLGYWCWHADLARRKYVGLWGHALWHIFTAAAIPVVYAAVHGRS